MAQHTPGPWDWQDGHLIGNLNSEGVDVLLDMDANARLIAAAPDLLAALDQVDAYLSPFDGEEDAYAEIRSVIQQAIAKAKGE